MEKLSKNSENVMVTIPSKIPQTTFYDLCRLCLESPGIRTFEENSKLLDDIYCFTGVKVSLNDNLPQHICKQCLRTIKKMKALKTLTNTNDHQLRFLFDEFEKPDTDEQQQPESSTSSKEIDSTTKSTSKHSCKHCGCHRKTSSPPTESAKDKRHSPKKPSISVRSDLFTETLKSLNDAAPEKTESKKSLKQRVLEMTTTSPSDTENPPESKKVKVEYSVKDSAFICTECNKQFTEWKKFYHHKRQHNPSEMCPFDACLKKFTTKNDLAKHVRTHTGEKPYKCSFCEKRFTQKVTMRQHELCHSNKKKLPKANY